MTSREIKGNFRDAVLRRLNSIQEQQKPINPAPLRYSSAYTDSWKVEKEILMEMLEKTQKLQISSQQAWSQERETWLKQFKQLEVSSKAQIEALKQDNDRLLADLAQIKSVETAEVSSKGELSRQLQEVKQRYQEKEQSYTDQIRTLESAIEDYKETLLKTKESMEKRRALAEENSAIVEAKAGEAVSTLRKELTRLQLLIKEKDEMMREQTQEAALTRSLLETLKRRKVTKHVTVQTEGLREERNAQGEDREERERQLQASISALQQQFLTLQATNASLQSALFASQQPLAAPSLEALLTHVAKALQAVLAKDAGTLVEKASGWEEWKKEVEKGIEVCREMSGTLSSFSTSDRNCKLLIELYASSLKTLLETARSLRPDSSMPSLLLQTDNEKLRAERDFLLSKLERAQEQGKPDIPEVMRSLNNALSTLQTLPSLLEHGFELQENRNRQLVQACPFPTALLEQLLAALEQQRKPEVSQLEQQRDRLEAAFRQLKLFHEQELERLSGQFASFQALVQAERTRSRESIARIAEAVEYRQEIWEQYQRAEGEEREEMAEELERQTLWEIKALEGLVGGLEETVDIEENRESVTVIKEASEEEEEDPAPVVVRLG